MKKITKIIVSSVIGGIGFLSTILAHINFSNVVNRGNDISQNWMEMVNGETSLARISIPGSHDSGSLYSLVDLAGKCQDVSIKNQLNFGVRYLDIRLELYDNKLVVVHGFVDQKLSFQKVVEDCKDFLKYHPTETIIMSIKEEVAAKEGAFEEKLKLQIQKDNDDKDESKQLWFLENKIPTLEEVRGKIVLQSRYKNSTIGVPLYNGWEEPQNNEEINTFTIDTTNGKYDVQDYYKFKKVETKWNAVELMLNKSSSNFENEIYTMNFLSGYLLGDFPPSYSVPTARYINKKAKEELNKYKFTGTVIMDFVSSDLCKAVYGRNF